MPKRVHTLPQADFMGGLNLDADAFQLAKNDSPAMLNVDINPLGGFTRRLPVARKSVLAAGVDGTRMFWRDGNDIIFPYADATYGGFTYSQNASTWTQVTWPIAKGGMRNMASYTDENEPSYNVTYFGRGSGVPAHSVARWVPGAASVTDLTRTVWNEDFANPTQGNMPLGSHMTQHLEYMFVGGLSEVGGLYGGDVVFGNRVRFSHPGHVEDWRVDDWFDVGDADHITAMVSFKTDLLIFKSHEVWLLRGYDADTFSLENISRTVGASNAGAVVVAENGVYFCGYPHGVYLFGPNGLEWVSEKIDEMWASRHIDQTSAANTTLAWIDKRLYFCTSALDSFPFQGIWKSMVFVLDPSLPPHSWSAHVYGAVTADGGVGFVSAIGTPDTLQTFRGLAVLDDTNQKTLVRFTDVNDSYTGDNIGAVDYPIDSYYTTSWQDLGDSAIVKTWGRPVVVLDNAEQGTLTCEVYRDYDSTTAVRTFPIVATGQAGESFLWGDDWGVGDWSAPAGAQLKIVKGGRLGRATSVSLKIKGSFENTYWAVNSIVWKYIPKRVRS